MIVRSRERPSEVWHRFRMPAEGFEVEDRADIFAARVVAGAVRAVEIFDRLTSRLGELVDVSLEDARSGVLWSGRAISRDAVRVSLEPLRTVLTNFAGVDCTLLDGTSQITLGIHLEVFVYSRSERWYYILRGLGLSHYDRIEARSWRLERDRLPPSAVPGEAIQLVARSIGLAED